MKKLLNECWYSFVFYRYSNVDLSNFQCMFKQSVIDCFIHELYVLQEYKSFKNGFGYAKVFYEILHF